MAQLTKPSIIKPDYANAYYNKAVSYVLQGEVDPGLENLQRAIGLNRRYRDDAKTDPSFDSLWEDEWFRQLVED
ncbi:MAG: hypothetical protein HC832_03785 [Leptolyngbyaceae cyanobacterium RM1_405_57]|nr:hypothetical protein [Leptolyngbyaceae cyanobacterium RM1_405_57]